MCVDSSAVDVAILHHCRKQTLNSLAGFAWLTLFLAVVAKVMRFFDVVIVIVAGYVSFGRRAVTIKVIVVVVVVAVGTIKEKAQWLSAA